MATKKKKRKARRARRNPRKARGISKKAYARLLAQVRRMKNGRKKARRKKKSNPRPRRRNRSINSGKLGRWYTGPKGVKVRMVNRGDKRFVEMRAR